MSAFETERQRLRLDRTHGASALSRRCLATMADAAATAPAVDAAALVGTLRHWAGLLAATRPSMLPIRNLLQDFSTRIEPLASRPIVDARAEAAEEARRLIAASLAATEAASRVAAASLVGAGTIITLSWSSTVLATLLRLARMHVRVTVAEARPLCEGAALARELAQAGVATTLITDAQIGIFAERADAALIGADAVLYDGNVLNKAGTKLLALACRDARVPTYVVCESFKVARDSGLRPELEENEAEELGHAATGFAVRNVYFDETPARLIDSWFLEAGALAPPFGFPEGSPDRRAIL